MTITIEFESSQVIYHYAAKPKTCRKPARLGAAAEGCGGDVHLAIKQGGVSKLSKSAYLDLTTNGIGSGLFANELRPKGAYNHFTKATGRVVRTVEYIDPDGPGIPEEHTLVFRVEGGFYWANPSSGGQAIVLFLQLVSSDDPTCMHTRRANLRALDSGSKGNNAVPLDLSDCREQSLVLEQKEPGRKPLVQVAITAKENG